jgi:hypothetical protein
MRKGKVYLTDNKDELYEELNKIETEIGLLDGKKLCLMEKAAQIKDKLFDLGEEVF